MRRPVRLRRRRIIYRRACAPLRHVAPLGRTAHSVALYSRQRNGTPAATVRRSWLSCQPQSKCVPFANLRKICSFAKFSTLNLHFASLNAPLRSQNIYILRNLPDVLVARRSVAKCLTAPRINIFRSSRTVAPRLYRRK